MALASDTDTPAGTCGVHAVHFLAALALVAGVADAGAHDAGAMTAAGHVNTLVGRHVTFGTLPATVAQAPALHVLAVPTAQHGTGCSATVRAQKTQEAVAGPGNAVTVTIAVAGAVIH